jgi:hypothetical protein
MTQGINSMPNNGDKLNGKVQVAASIIHLGSFITTITLLCFSDDVSHNQSKRADMAKLSCFVQNNNKSGTFTILMVEPLEIDR